MAVIAWLWRHRDFDVYVIPLSTPISPVDLHGYTQEHRQLNDMELLPLSVSLELFSVAVISGLDWRVKVAPLRWEALQNWLSIL